MNSKQNAILAATIKMKSGTCAHLLVSTLQKNIEKEKSKQIVRLTFPFVLFEVVVSGGN